MVLKTSKEGGCITMTKMEALLIHDAFVKDPVKESWVTKMEWYEYKGLINCLEFILLGKDISTDEVYEMVKVKQRNNEQHSDIF